MQPSVLIGNDVVDLSLPETQEKDRLSRFAKRVCTREEQTLLAGTDRPHLMLWALWSAKETAYKIAKKHRSETIFSPIRFIVEPASLPLFSGESVAIGNVRYQGTEIQVRWHSAEEYIHCVGIWADRSLNEVLVAVAREGDRSLQEVVGEKPLSLREELSAPSPASQQARQLAKQLLAEQGFRDVEIVREQNQERFDPPRAWHHGRLLAGCDLSLSHHGRFVAAAVWVEGDVARAESG